MRWRWIVPGTILLLGAAWIGVAGRVLVTSHQPEKPEAIFVLSGDRFASRIMDGAAMMRQSDADRLVVFLAFGYVYDPRADAVSYLESKGVSSERVRFIPAKDSTASEGAVTARLAARCGWKEIAILTSPYSSRRASWLLDRSVTSGTSARVVASTEPFDATRWWKSERDAEIVAIEWLKGLNSLIRYSMRAPTATDPGVEC